MNSKRMFFVMVGVLVLLFAGLLGGTYGVNNLLQQRAKKLSDIKTQEASLESQQRGLKSAKAQVAKYSDLEKIAKTIVPQDKDQAAAVREISGLAAASGIKQLSSITFPASTLGGVQTTPSTSSTGSASLSAPSTTKSNLTQLQPAKGLTGVYQLQITITQASENKVTYNQFYDFLTRLEQNRRTAQVTGVTLQPDANNPNNVAFTLIINEFIKP